MSQALTKVKKRINSINSTRKITNAMKLVSSVKYKKIEKGSAERKEYIAILEETFSYLLSHLEEYEIFPLLSENNKSNTNLYIVISSSMGLCGAYNYNLIKYFNQLVKTTDEIIPIGEKIYKEVKKDNNFVLNCDFIDLASHIDIPKINKLSNLITEGYLAGKYKKVTIVYTKYVNQLANKVVSEELLPFKNKFNEKYRLKYVDFDCKCDDIIVDFSKKYISSILLLALKEAYLSEQSARRNAMENADKNAKDLSKKLNLEYNKARQASITQEITEVSGGNLEN